MSSLASMLDIAMCVLWVLTYTLVLIGTITYRFPLISPATQAVIAPFEFAVFIKFIYRDALGFDYVFLSYAYWTAIEIAIIYQIVRIGFINKNRVIPYVFVITVLTCIMCYCVIANKYMFFFSYFNTFVGEIFWLVFILKKDYPMRPIALAAFFAKFIGDAISIVPYFGHGGFLINFICLTLPLLDLAFIFIYFKRKCLINTRS